MQHLSQPRADNVNSSTDSYKNSISESDVVSVMRFVMSFRMEMLVSLNVSTNFLFSGFLDSILTVSCTQRATIKHKPFSFLQQKLTSSKEIMNIWSSACNWNLQTPLYHKSNKRKILSLPGGFAILRAICWLKYDCV